MEQYKILLFLCNWGPYAAFQKLQDMGGVIPPGIKMVRIPCAGRISKALLINAFEKGADGVALVGCTSGSCRYGSGTATASENTSDMRNILDLVGIGKERLQHATFLPDESDRMLRFLENFCDEIREIGPSPVIPAERSEADVDFTPALKEIALSHNLFACQDCGKCTSACPVSIIGKPFSPRALANSISSLNVDYDSVKDNVWSCLTCGLCRDRCLASVDFPDFIRNIRSVFNDRKDRKIEAHGGFFHKLMRTMTSPDLKIKHWDWLPKTIERDQKSKVLFFGGCAPYFDIFFRKFLDVNTRDILTDALYLLNFFDVQPALLNAERCCGHDLLWSGDKANFIKLAKKNVELIENMGIEEVITACPECYTTLATDYKKYGIDLNFKVTHLYDFLGKEIGKGPVGFKKFDKNITYQDSCRLCRFTDMGNLPGSLIDRLNPKKFTEMRFSGTAAVCCGNSAWIGCDSYTKALQVTRLTQVQETQSDLLITSCPKCQIHFKCAMEDPFYGEKIKIDMMDLTSVIAKTIYWE